MIMRVRRLGEILITIDGRRLGDHRLGETPITNDARRDARRLDEILITMDRRDLEVVATSTTCVTPIAIAFDAIRACTRCARRRAPFERYSIDVGASDCERLGLRKLRQFQLRAQVGVFSVLHAR
jgi:hypothetical protein